MRKAYIAIIIAACIVALSSSSVSQAAPPSPDLYDPAAYSVPASIAGMNALALLTEANFPGMMPGEKRLVLQSNQPSIEKFLKETRVTLVEEQLRGSNLAELAAWGWEVVGPALDRASLVTQAQQLQTTFKGKGGFRFGPPSNDSLSPQGGQKRKNPPYPGYVIIQNKDADKYHDIIAQSVELWAPVLVGAKQTSYSGFLENVLTNKNYYLQVGFGFIKNYGGYTIWTDSTHNLEAQFFNSTFDRGAPYYTTITWQTGGGWWMCEGDEWVSGNYVCQFESKAKGGYLSNDVATSVFFENWNANADGLYGFDSEFSATRAYNYRKNKPRKYWTSEDKWTIHATQVNYPPSKAIHGSLVGGGEADIQKVYVPICTPSFLQPNYCRR